MKNGTLYAKRVKRVYKQLQTRDGPSVSEEPSPPVEQLVRALLGWESTPAVADQAFRALFEKMVDFNEVRVATVPEIDIVIRDLVPNSSQCARSISRSLNSIYRREHRVNLDELRDKGRREARHYLESLNGISPFASASVLLWSLGAHAIPVRQGLLEALRSNDLIDPDAGPSEVQGFLERNIAAAEAKRFCLTMEKLVDQKPKAAASKNKATGSKSTGTGRKQKSGRR
ncbi:MAG: hypothetical protein GY778_26500 [bacterium]|nr:hypothetical protein [bacterium]